MGPHFPTFPDISRPPKERIPSISDVAPEHVGSPLLQDGLLVVVEQVAGVEHVEEVELGVDGDGGLQPGLVCSCTLLYRQLLKEWR